MQYIKPPLSYEQQAQRLINRGLRAEKSLLIARLQSVNYYRLAGYLYSFRQPNSDLFFQDTTLDVVWRRYTFDRHLRFLLLDAIERFEVALKTDITYNVTQHYGPFGYLNASNLPLISREKFTELQNRIQHEVKRSREEFIHHFTLKYGDIHVLPPLWMTVEVISFGTTLSLYRGFATIIKRDIAKRYGVHDHVFESWITALNAVRNICAHHGRLWNREFGYKPLIPKKTAFMGRACCY